MKKVFTTAAAVTLLILGTQPIINAENSIDVNVTISDSKGELTVKQEKLSVTDADSDGQFTINDALILAHDKYYTGGSKSGYGYEGSGSSLTLTKLWGSEEGYKYGFYKNDTAADSLGDSISANDYINAFVFTDKEKNSDKYCWFDERSVTAKAGESINVKLMGLAVDSNNKTETKPIGNATLYVDGKKTDFTTNSNGEVTFTLEAGTHTVSAKSSSETIVPPILKAEVTQTSAATTTGGNASTATTTTTVAGTTTAPTTTTTAAGTTAVTTTTQVTLAPAVTTTTTATNARSNYYNRVVTTTVTTRNTASTTTSKKVNSPSTGESAPAVGLLPLAGAAALMAVYFGKKKK